MKSIVTLVAIALTLFNVGVALVAAVVGVIVVGLWFMWSTVDDMQTKLAAHAVSIEKLDEQMAAVDAILRADEG
jgi:hypothetical protein